MHQHIMRLVGVAAAVLVANAAAVPVLCGAIDAVWQEQAAVAGNYPECEAYYDSSNLDQTVDLDSDHPHLARFNACKRYGATTWACPTVGEHEVDDGSESEQIEEENHESLKATRFRKRTSTAGWKLSGIQRREVVDNTEPEQAEQANDEPRMSARVCKRAFTTTWGCPGAGKRENQGTKDKNGNWPPHKRGALAASNSDAKPGVGLNAASGIPGNWPPNKRQALTPSNSDAKPGLGLDVASNTLGNWPPHEPLDVADKE